VDSDEHVPFRMEATGFSGNAVGAEFFHLFDETFVVAVDLEATGGKGEVTVRKHVGYEEKASFAARYFGTVRFRIVAEYCTTTLGNTGSSRGGDNPTVASVSVTGATVGDKEDVVEVLEEVCNVINRGL
jgi:hypothetical protein